MKRALLTDMGLDSEQVDKIMKAHGDTVNGLKDELDSVDDLKQQIEDYKKEVKSRDDQLEELEKKAKGNEELTAEIETWKEKNKQTAEQLERTRKEAAVKLQLGSQLNDPEDAFRYLEIDELKLDGDKVLGLDDKINELREKKDYLFKKEEVPVGLKGRTENAPSAKQQSGTVTKDQFNKMGYRERVSLYQENPDLYSQLTNE